MPAVTRDQFRRHLSKGRPGPLNPHPEPSHPTRGAHRTSSPDTRGAGASTPHAFTGVKCSVRAPGHIATARNSEEMLPTRWPHTAFLEPPRTVSEGRCLYTSCPPSPLHRPSRWVTHVQGVVAAAATGRPGSQLAQLGLGRLLGREGLLQAAAEDAHGVLVGLVLGFHLLLCAAQVRAQLLQLPLLLGDGPGAWQRQQRVSAHLRPTCHTQQRPSASPSKLHPPLPPAPSSPALRCPESSSPGCGRWASPAEPSTVLSSVLLPSWRCLNHLVETEKSPLLPNRKASSTLPDQQQETQRSGSQSASG